MNNVLFDHDFLTVSTVNSEFCFEARFEEKHELNGNHNFGQKKKNNQIFSQNH